MAAAMYAITESSARLADLIAEIEPILLETGILALNATVEAARAGEQGRESAPVATDLRHLALRCSAAMREIRAQVQDHLRCVGHGAQLAHQPAPGSTMQRPG